MVQARVVAAGVDPALFGRYSLRVSSSHRLQPPECAAAAIVSGQQSIFGAALADANTVKVANPELHLEVKFIMATFPLAIGLRRAAPALQAWLDDWVAANFKNGKLSAIYQKYFGVPLPADLGN